MLTRAPHELSLKPARERALRAEMGQGHCRCESIDEAVAFGRALRDSGHYTWFRGQKQDWPVISSLHRLRDQADIEAAVGSASRFIQWIESTPGLEALRGREDDQLAIGQHHGLKTTFIDFTIDPAVAAFFASHGCTYQKPHDGVIICLDRDEIRGVHDILRPRNPDVKIEFLELAVAGLWRLEAQRGVFVYSNALLEPTFAFPKIYFPCTGAVSAPAPSDVFPDPSPLETLLTQYFALERMRRAQPVFDQVFQGFVRIPLESELVGSVPPDPSWAEGVAAGWQAVPDLRLESIGHRTLTLRFDSRLGAARVGQSTAEQMLAALADAGVRRAHVAWELVNDAGSNRIELRQVRKLLESIWAAMRPLPYADEDMAAAVATIIGGAMLGIDRLRRAGSDKRVDLASALFQEPIEVEYGGSDGSYTRGLVSRTKLSEALRPDLVAKLTQAQSLAPLIGGRLDFLMASVPEPARLFDFPKFARVYAAQILPTTLLIREDHLAIYASPARVTRLGPR